MELRLVSELMRNCRRSDKTLAEILGTSTIAVNRMIKKLEKNRYIRGYSAVPNFPKIGFSILAITFAKLKQPITPEKLKKGRQDAKVMLSKESAPAIIGMSGIGCEADPVLVTFHENYGGHLHYLRFLQSQSLVKVDGVKSFVVDLKDESQFLPLSFEYLAGYILRQRMSASTE
jgi:DNA-binding Lrp family transcriptional regulator